ncbi:hypothetical protein O4H62_24340 [Hoeflea alexandrii]|nr:hypothetical protein [Hoeflea alexandrii]
MEKIGDQAVEIPPDMSRQRYRLTLWQLPSDRVSESALSPPYPVFATEPDIGG